MNRKIILTTILLIIMSGFAVLVFASDEIVNPASDSVKVGEKLKFSVDVDQLRENETDTFKISIGIAPTEPVMSLDLKEDADLTVNKVSGKYSVSSSDIMNYKTLNFSLESRENIEEAVEYTLSVSVIGDITYDSDFTFTLEPAANEPKEDEAKEDETKEDVDDEDLNNNDTNEDAKEKADKKPTKNDKGTAIKGGGGFSGDDGDDLYKYKGSSDNYLSELSVSGHTLTQPFNKTRTVYFIDAESDVTSLDVTAVPCDRAAKVNIAGNDNVGVDYSKIIIDVSAINGDTRTYTIYVRH